MPDKAAQCVLDCHGQEAVRLIDWWTVVVDAHQQNALPLFLDAEFLMMPVFHTISFRRVDVFAYELLRKLFYCEIQNNSLFDNFFVTNSVLIQA